MLCDAGISNALTALISFEPSLLFRTTCLAGKQSIHDLENIILHLVGFDNSEIDFYLHYLSFFLFFCLASWKKDLQKPVVQLE